MTDGRTCNPPDGRKLRESMGVLQRQGRQPPKEILIISIILLRSTSDPPHQYKPAAIQQVKNIPRQYAHDASPTSQPPKRIIRLKMPLKSGLFPDTSTRILFPNLEPGYFSAMLLSLSIVLLEARKISKEPNWEINFFAFPLRQLVNSILWSALICDRRPSDVLCLPSPCRSLAKMNQCP